MRKAIVLALALAAIPAWADLPRGEWRTARQVKLPKLPRSALVYLPLDAVALAGVKSLSEYRVVRDSGVEVPYRMVLEDGRTETRSLTPRIISQGRLGREEARVALDLGSGAPPANRVGLVLHGDNFRCWAKVEGSNDQRRWWVLTAKGIVYRHEGRFEQTWVPVQINEFRYLRVTLSALQGDLPRIDGARAANELTIPRELAEVPAVMSQRENARQHATVLSLDLGKSSRDLAEARFDVAEPAFDRPVDMAVAGPAVHAPGGMQYEFLGEGRLQRLAAGKAAVLPLDIPAAQRLRLTIHNGDDPPLAIRGVELFRVRRGLVFSADPAQRYDLWYGRADARQPEYEIQRLPLATPPARLPLATLGPARRLPVKPPPPPPWSEQHPVLFWAALSGVVVLLMLAIVRAMRSVKTAPPGA